MRTAERHQERAYRVALAGEVEHAHSLVGGPVTVEVDGKTIATAEYLAAVTVELRSLGRRVASDTARIGGLLNEVKTKLGYGQGYTRFVVNELGTGQCAPPTISATSTRCSDRQNLPKSIFRG